MNDDNEVKRQQELLKNLDPVARIINLTNSWGVKVAKDQWSDHPLIWLNNKECYVAIEVEDSINRDKLMAAFEKTNFNWTEPTQMSNGNWLVKASSVSSFKANGATH